MSNHDWTMTQHLKTNLWLFYLFIPGLYKWSNIPELLHLEKLKTNQSFRVFDLFVCWIFVWTLFQLLIFFCFFSQWLRCWWTCWTSALTTSWCQKETTPVKVRGSDTVTDVWQISRSLLDVCQRVEIKDRWDEEEEEEKEELENRKKKLNKISWFLSFSTTTCLFHRWRSCCEEGGDQE